MKSRERPLFKTSYLAFLESQYSQIFIFLAASTSLLPYSSFPNPPYFPNPLLSYLSTSLLLPTSLPSLLPYFSLLSYLSTSLLSYPPTLATSLLLYFPTLPTSPIPDKLLRKLKLKKNKYKLKRREKSDKTQGNAASIKTVENMLETLERTADQLRLKRWNEIQVEDISKCLSKIQNYSQKSPMPATMVHSNSVPIFTPFTTHANAPPSVLTSPYASSSNLSSLPAASNSSTPFVKSIAEIEDDLVIVSSELTSIISSLNSKQFNAQRDALLFLEERLNTGISSPSPPYPPSLLPLPFSHSSSLPLLPLLTPFPFSLFFLSLFLSLPLLSLLSLLPSSFSPSLAPSLPFICFSFSLLKIFFIYFG